MKNYEKERHIMVSNLELWAARICVLAILAMSGWATKEFHYSQISLNTKISKVEKELEDTKPRDIITALNNSNKELQEKLGEVEDKVLSKEDVRSIIMDHSPWPLVEKDWETWRLRIETDLIEIRKDIQSIMEDRNVK